jgi:hypothetical protein
MILKLFQIETLAIIITYHVSDFSIAVYHDLEEPDANEH